MRMSWRLGRFAGIDVYLHATFLMLLAWVGATQGGLESVLFVSSVFGCVLLHEYGHALTARRYGIDTEDITLYPIGGVARLRRMPRAPGAELVIAVAGPAVNLVIALAIIALNIVGAGIAGAGWTASPIAEYSAVLLQINVGLALFNLIPAFPMDGGRVLRAMLSNWLGRARATLVAASLARGLAVLFGLYSVFISGYLMHAVLAAFIYLMAGVELKRVLAEERQPEETRSEGIWTAPPGFRWVSLGNGVWRLAPIPVAVHPRGEWSRWG